MKPFVHASERRLGGHGLTAAEFIRAGQRCYCFSASDATTTDQRATATDTARSQSGSRNIQATDRGRVTTGGVGENRGVLIDLGQRGQLSQGNIRAEKGSTVNVGVRSEDLAALLGEAITAGQQQISDATPSPANSAAPGADAGATDAGAESAANKNKLLIAAGVGVLALVLLKPWKRL